MRVKIPEFNNKKQLHSYLVQNKKDLIRQKCSMPIKSDSIVAMPSVMTPQDLNTFGVKGVNFKNNGDIPEGVVRVKVVANAANFVDSYLDLLLPDAPAKSIKERKGLIPHLHDHIHTTEAEVGDVLDIYLADISLTELGWNAPGTTQGVIFLTDIIEEYNPKVFKRYKTGRAKQHSIGLQYVKLELAVNDPDYEKEYDFFMKYYDQIINKDIVDHYGYYWVVAEYKLIENSVVLFGANQLTPTLEVTESSKGEPEQSTQKSKPANATQTAERLKALNSLINKINNTKQAWNKN